jgi:hypothetical protein
MNSQLNYLAVKAQMDERVWAAEQARLAGAGGSSGPAGRARGALASFGARRAARIRPAARLKPQACVEDH